MTDNQYLHRILKANGVDNPDGFLALPECPDIYEPSLFRRMNYAVGIGQRIVEGSIKKVGIQIDPDVDGFTSAAAIDMILRALNPGVCVRHFFPEGKQHGFNSNAIDGHEFDLFIVPDAGSDPESFNEYRSRDDILFLVLDHHPYNHLDIPENCVLVNCQDEQYPNSTLTGVGVVFKFFEAMYHGLSRLGKSELGNEYDSVAQKLWKLWNPLLQLVALGMIADVADLRNLESRYYVLLGLEKMNEDLKLLRSGMKQSRPHSLMAELLLAADYSVPYGATIMSVGWYVAPPINAMIRLGSYIDKQALFDALCYDDSQIPYQPRRKKKTDPKPEVQMLSCQNNVARLCRNIKVRQDKLTRAAQLKYMDSISRESIDKDSFLIVHRTKEDDTPRELTGLIANKLTAIYHRPVLVVTEDKNGMCSGSGRGYDKAGIADFKGVLDATGYCDMLGGHPNAFGIRISADKMRPLQDMVNRAIPLDTMEVSYTVDYEVDANKLTAERVEEVGELYELWGNHVDEPQFAIVNIRLKPEEIESYNNGRIISFTYNGIRYSKQFCKSNEYADITQASNRHRIGPQKDLELVVIGVFRTHEKDGETYVNVEIKEWCSWERADWDPDDF